MGFNTELPLEFRIEIDFLRREENRRNRRKTFEEQERTNSTQETMLYLLTAPRVRESNPSRIGEERVLPYATRVFHYEIKI